MTDIIETPLESRYSMSKAAKTAYENIFYNIYKDLQSHADELSALANAALEAYERLIGEE